MGGITEEWRQSVCLFHAMFGGECHLRELHAWHSQLRPYNISDLKGFKDEHDGMLYEHAVYAFRAKLQDYAVTPASCDSQICRLPTCQLVSKRANAVTKCSTSDSEPRRWRG